MHSNLDSYSNSLAQRRATRGGHIDQCALALLMYRPALEFFAGTESANDILDWPAFQAADQGTEIDLVVTSIAHLGLREKAGHHSICARARELGLELCPAEVGPQLRLQYLTQPAADWLKIAMEPLQPSGHSPLIFSVDGTFRRYLDTRYAYNVWYSSERFVFVKPRSY